MDWTRPYKVAYLCKRLDRASGVPVADIELHSCSISLADEGVGMSASLEFAKPVLDYPIVRVSARVEQDGSVETVDLFTGHVHCSDKKWGVGDAIGEMEGHGLLEAAKGREVAIGRTIPAKTQRAQMAATLLREALPKWAQVRVTGESPRLSEPLVAEEGETHLSMAEKLLADCDWHIRRLGDGSFEIAPYGNVVASIDVKDDDVLLPDITDQRDRFEAVTVLRVIGANGGSVVVKDQETIDLLGFERWQTERNVSLSDDQTLDGYARSRLSEANDFSRDVSWSREFLPGVCCGDTFKADIVSHGIEGKFRSKTMDITCEAGITVDEVVSQRG